MTVASADPVAVTPPTAGLDWACGLLFDHDRAVARRPGGPAVPGGYRCAESYLALPRASEPRLLVPLRSSRAAAAALGRNHDATSRVARLGRAALGAGLRVGLTQRLAGRVDVMVDPSPAGAERPPVLLTDHLREVFARPDLEMAVILGVPRLNRKPVLQLLSPDGSVVGYAKAAWNELTAGLVRNESRVLADLASHAGGAGPATFTAPTLVGHGPWGGLELICASALPNAARPDPAQASDPPLAAIAEIAGLWGRRTGPLAGSSYWAGVRARLAEQSRQSAEPGPGNPGGDGPDVLAGALQWVERRHGAVETAFGAWHGDFTPWNMARLAGGTFIWDWERTAPAPVGLDLAHFLFQSACRFEGRAPAAALDVSSERARSLLPHLDVAPASEDALWAVYRLELLFRYEEARRAGVLARPSKIHAGIIEMFIRDMEA